jgi:hypothetical protein
MLNIAAIHTQKRKSKFTDRRRCWRMLSSLCADVFKFVEASAKIVGIKTGY